MLTTAYYYGLYAPYIFSRQQSRQIPGDSARRAGQPAHNVVSLEKNNTVRGDVVDYARGIYSSVTEMKDASKYLFQNAENYYVTVLNESFETARDWAFEDLSVFVNAYNAVMSFSEEQNHSRELTRYTEDIAAISREHEDDLAQAGVSLRVGGSRMSFDRRPLMETDMDYLELAQALTGAGEAAGDIYERTTALMERPISDHMDFKQLSYYYNYHISRYLSPSGVNRERQLPTIESGMILDRII